mgnify:CR=1 FL=1
MKRFSKKEIFFDSESDGIFSDSVNSGVLLPVYHGRNGTRIFVCSAGCSALQPDRSV